MGMDKKIEKKKWPWWRIALYVAIVAGVGYAVGAAPESLQGRHAEPFLGLIKNLLTQPLKILVAPVCNLPPVQLLADMGNQLFD